MRRCSRLVGVLALSLAVASCGGVGGGGDADNGGSDGGGTSGVVDTMGFSLQDVIATTRVNVVKEEYPDLRVRVAEGAFDEQQFLSAVASGEPPSLVYLPRDELGSYAARGAITPLDDCVDSQDIDVDQYRDVAVETVTYDDQLYGIPEFAAARIILADVDALKQTRRSADDISTADWDELKSAAAELTRKQGGNLQRIGFDPKIPEFFPLWVAANGGQLVSDDGLTANLDSPEAVEALEYTVSLVETSAPWPRFKAFRDTWDFFGGQNQFVANQLGAFPMEDFYIDVLAEVSPKTPISARPFESREGTPLNYSTGQAWAIPKDGGNPEGACAFMKTMTEAGTWVAAAEASKADREKGGGVYTGTFTANEEADERIFDEVYEETGFEGLDQATQVVLDVQGDAIVDPASPAGAEIKKAWQDAILRALEGEQSAQETLERAQREAQAAIDEATRQ